ncbi:MAG: pyrroline-5-carboxylate reductase [Gammaproteobacteria bacterium]|nr:MAG: pyrroline-5-carboxylate reductase [Gammaproteobacteria bacterium]
MNSTYQYAFIGAGHMAKGIINGLLANAIDGKNIITSTRTVASGNQLMAEFGVHNSQDNNACLDADIIVLAVKPQMLTTVLSAMDSEKLAKKLIVSVIAGVACQVYRQHISDNIRLVRTMPNMPAKIGQGMTGMYAENCSVADKVAAEDLMRCTGKTLWVEKEAGIDYVNAISGSGPAYVYGFIHYLAQAGERLGLSYQDALTLALQTVIGSARLAEQDNDGTAESLQALIGQITSKGGTTFEAMQSFEQDNFAGVIDNAVQRCYQRALELRQQD